MTYADEDTGTLTGHWPYTVRLESSTNEGKMGRGWRGGSVLLQVCMYSITSVYCFSGGNMTDLHLKTVASWRSLASFWPKPERLINEGAGPRQWFICRVDDGDGHYQGSVSCILCDKGNVSCIGKLNVDLPCVTKQKQKVSAAPVHLQPGHLASCLYPSRVACVIQSTYPTDSQHTIGLFPFLPLPRHESDGLSGRRGRVRSTIWVRWRVKAFFFAGEAGAGRSHMAHTFCHAVSPKQFSFWVHGSHGHGETRG